MLTRRVKEFESLSTQASDLTDIMLTRFPPRLACFAINQARIELRIPRRRTSCDFSTGLSRWLKNNSRQGGWLSYAFARATGTNHSVDNSTPAAPIQSVFAMPILPARNPPASALIGSIPREAS